MQGPAGGRARIADSLALPGAEAAQLDLPDFRDPARACILLSCDPQVAD
jgi:hypothetical protein